MAAIYSLIAIVWTWPLVRHLPTRIASDLGDPLFNSWVLAWTSGQVLRALGGDVAALGRYWHGNIFHPEPLTLAYSEHLTAQTIQGLPIFAATGNILVTYNLLFIATFALSGLGMYLFVRELTGRPLAAFFAGLAFAYAPYRLGQFSHLQVLSSYWMPLALYGFRRYFATGRVRALGGGAAALVMQNLSCGYFMLFFTPFAAAYCLYEMAARRRLASRRVWTHVLSAAIAVALATWPFISPYLQLREQQELGVRNASEIQMFSADTYAFASIAPNSRLLAEARAGHWAPEGEGFVGFTILAFAIVGLAAGAIRVMRGVPWRLLPRWHTTAIVVAGLASVGSVVLVLWYFIGAGVQVTWSGERFLYRNAALPLRIALFSAASFVVLRTLAARRGAAAEPTAFGFTVLSSAAAALLALGPRIHSLGRSLGEGPYAWLLDYVPGFDGLRVPARFLMVSALFLAVLAGFGAAALLASRLKRVGATVVLIGAVGILAESWVAPLQTNIPVIPAEEFTIPPAPAAGRRTPPVYRQIRDLPGDLVLLELPYGVQAYDLVATFYAGYHLRPLVNGYSGFFPASYIGRIDALRRPIDDPAAAAEALRTSGATHVLLHQSAYSNDTGVRIADWLLALGAKQVSVHQTDRLFELR
jgi:hypothetical protein